MFVRLVDDVMRALLPSRRAPSDLAAFPAALAPAPPGVDALVACFAYAGEVRESIARAKYRNERAALRPLARDLATTAQTFAGAVDVVTWAPASRARRRRSGVDHGESIARVVARRLGVPATRLLIRGDDGEQTRASARRRRAGPALHVRPHAAVPSRVLVVDDVTTTGGTLASAARALRAHGALVVVAATIARTPGPEGGRLTQSYTSSHNTSDRASGA